MRTLPQFGAPPTAGSYYAPVSSGHGWDVHVNDAGETVIYWFTGRESGEPRWLYCSGEGGTELDLFEIRGATLANPASGLPEKVGSCRFTGDRFAFRLDGVRGGIKVKALLPTPTMSGIYYYAPRNNEGIAVHFFTDLHGVERCAVYFYTYRYNAYGVRHTDTWYSCEGVLEGKGYTLTIFQTEGRFQSFGARTAKVGEGTLSVRGDAVDFGFAIGKRVENYTMEVVFRG